MLNDDALVLYRLGRYVEVKTLVDRKPPLARVSQDHALAIEIDATTKDIVSKKKHRETVALCVLSHVFAARLQHIIGVDPKKIIARRNVEAQLARGSKIINVRPI